MDVKSPHFEFYSEQSSRFCQRKIHAMECDYNEREPKKVVSHLKLCSLLRKTGKVVITDQPISGRCDCSEDSPFRNVRDVEVEHVSNIDVKVFSGVYSLSLKNCHEILNIGSLCNLHTISASDCSNVGDAGALGTVQNLSFTKCRNVSNIDALGEIHSGNQRNSSSPTSGRSISLIDCPDVSSVRSLASYCTSAVHACVNVI